MSDPDTWPASLPIFEGKWSASPVSEHRRTGEGLNELARLARRREEFGLHPLEDVESGDRVRVTAIADSPLGTVQECFSNGTFAVRVEGIGRGGGAAFMLLAPGEFRRAV